MSNISLRLQNILIYFWFQIAPKLLEEWNDTQCEYDKVKKSLIDNQESLSINCPTPRDELPLQCRLILDQVDTSKGLVLGKARQNQGEKTEFKLLDLSSEKCFHGHIKMDRVRTVRNRCSINSGH